MKKVIAGVALVAIMVGCIFANNTTTNEPTTPAVADRWGVVIA